MSNSLLLFITKNVYPDPFSSKAFSLNLFQKFSKLLYWVSILFFSFPVTGLFLFILNQYRLWFSTPPKLNKIFFDVLYQIHLYDILIHLGCIYNHSCFYLINYLSCSNNFVDVFYN